jgi:hypothetical protein
MLPLTSLADSRHEVPKNQLVLLHNTATFGLWPTMAERIGILVIKGFK